MALITFQVGIKLFLRLPALLDFSWLDFIFFTKASQWSAPIVMLFAQIWRSKGKKLNHIWWQTDRGTAHDSGPWDRKTGRLGDVGTLEKKLVVASVVPRLPGRKTLVAAGHVTTQNLGGKKSVGQEGWQSVLFVAVTNFVDFNSSSSSFIGVRSRILPMKNATFFLRSLKYRRLSFTKKFGSQMEHKRFNS